MPLYSRDSINICRSLVVVYCVCSPKLLCLPIVHHTSNWLSWFCFSLCLYLSDCIFEMSWARGVTFFQTKPANHWNVILPSCTSGVLVCFSCGSTLIGLPKSKLCLLSSCNELLHGMLFSVNANHLVAHKRHLKSCVAIMVYLIFYLFCNRLPML